MKYFPEPVPYTDDLPYIREWLGREFSNILVAFEGVEMIQLTEDHINPTDPRDGMIKFADGTNWNPGQGRGFYAYRDSGWHKLDLGGSGADPDFITPVNFIHPGGARLVHIPADTNGAIEIGKVDGNISTPFIDFHSSATVADYNARIIASGGSGTSGSGTLTMHADTVGLANGRLFFPVTQNPSTDANTLDDYEEGTWTPVLTFSTPGDLSVGYTVQQARYVKFGKLVWVNFTVVTSSFTFTTSGGELRITGLPFTPISAVEFTGAMEAGSLGFGAGRTQVNTNIYGGNTFVRPVTSGAGVARTNLGIADAPSGTNRTYIGSVIYEATA